MANTRTKLDRSGRKALTDLRLAKSEAELINSNNSPPKRQKRTGGGELLKTPTEMARLAGFSKRTLGRLTKAKLVPVVCIGRLRFYDPGRVMAALHRNLEVKEVQA